MRRSGMNVLKSNERWIRIGLAGWAAVACIWMLDTGFQYHMNGDPVWWAGPNVVLALLPGIALTPLVFLAFRRLLAGPRSLPTRFFLYSAIGLAFWLTWGVMSFGVWHAGLFFAPPEDVGLVTSLFRSVATLFFNSLLLYSVMVMLHEAARHFDEARRQEYRTTQLQAELARARTAALQAQLNPHFLFNTLHVASGLASSDVHAARGVLRDLEELLRGPLARSGAQLVPLGDELRMVERYAEIQKARFMDRLHVDFRIDPDTLDLGVPSLLLQPLVENAVIHGAAHGEEGGRIHVRATRADGALCLAVVDSGRGFSGGAVEPAHERVGIGGTRARLKLLFGDDASLRYSYPAGGGFRAEVVLPEVRLDPPEGDLVDAGAAQGASP